MDPVYRAVYVEGRLSALVGRAFEAASPHGPEPSLAVPPPLIDGTFANADTEVGLFDSTAVGLVSSPRLEQSALRDVSSQPPVAAQGAPTILSDALDCSEQLAGGSVIIRREDSLKWLQVNEGDIELLLI